MSRMAVRIPAGLVSRASATCAAQASKDPFARTAVLVILTVMLAQIVFLVFGCDWDLCSDEAEFWAWSRRPALSYFARGPLIAWLIRVATELFGAPSLKITGSLMFAIRLPSVLLGGMTAWGIYRLASLTTGAKRAGLIAILLLPVIPVFAIGAVLTTCDTPLIFCWVWAAVWTYRAILDDHIGGWIFAGLIGAAGVLAKYSCLAFPASVGLFLVLSSVHRRQLGRPGFWVMSFLCGLIGLAPILVWNAQHGWAGANQLADRVGLSAKASWATVGPVLSFFGGDVAALGVIWWVVGLIAISGAFLVLAKASRTCAVGDARRDETGLAGTCAGLLYLLCLWGVIWSACLAASLLGETEANWMAPGYVGLVVLMGGRVDQVLSRGGMTARAYVATWCVSLFAVIAIHHTEWFYPLFADRAPATTDQLPAPFRLYDPTARMRGHRVLARAVADRLAVLQTQGASPFVLTPTYGLTSALSFYLPGQPETYCLSWNYGMTPKPVNQHDLWHPNPRHDPEAFKTRPAVVVEDANMPPSYAKRLVKKGVFGRLESPQRVVVREGGIIIGAWDIAVCYDYHGVDAYKQNMVRR
jgi:4-amino-4-deoxy-L-arabinose transferase-like glycosyltransferase